MPTKKVVVATVADPSRKVAKTAPKKVTKAATKSVSKVATKTVKATGRPLVYADNNTSFWVANGEILNNLAALGDAFAKMDKAVFAEHVTADKNDFANWVAAVLDDMECARDLKSAKTAGAAKTIVVRHLKLYSY